MTLTDVFRVLVDTLLVTALAEVPQDLEVVVCRAGIGLHAVQL